MTLELEDFFEAAREATHGQALADRWLALLRESGVHGLALQVGERLHRSGRCHGPARSEGPLRLWGASTLDETELLLLFELAGMSAHWLYRLHRFARISQRAQRDRLALRAEVADLAGADLGLLGQSSAMQEVRRLLRTVALHPTTVLLQGETGTGKEMAARALHRLSRRGDRFAAINCGALPSELIEAELFGYEKGAFTGAVRASRGLFRRAGKGTVFLDEVGELPLSAQARLLRVLQERVVTPLGAEDPVPVKARVVAATHRDLRAAMAEGTFREDLFYRLHVFHLRLPPLRDRREDIFALVDAKLHSICDRLGRAPPRVSPTVLTALSTYDWPGNVRELENELERAALLSGDSLEWSTPDLEPSGSPATTLDAAVKTAIEDALRSCGGRIYGPRGAAERLGLPPSTLQTKMRKLGISRDGFVSPTR
ncbi:MAG: sigma-54 dependent transcriptional regulator [Myxococcota bacterium]